MPRQYQRKPGAKPYNVVPAEKLDRAYTALNEKSQRQVCEEFDITRSVLQRYVERRQAGQIHRRPGGQTIFTDREEQSFVNHLVSVSNWGFPFDVMDLRMAVKRYLDREGRDVHCFKENLPGCEWANGFLKRHKNQIGQKLCQNISKKRAAVDEEVIMNYLEELKATLKDVPPTNIINFDETNLTDDPGKKKMIFKRGVRYPERIMNSSKSSTSLMLAGSASGQVLPVYVVYKAENLWSTWMEGGPDKCRYNRSKSGWFDHICFNDWFQSVALPYCQRLSGKVVLLGDNLSSHFSHEILKQCERQNISFVCLPANATHLLQPLDVAYFRPMKNKWRQILTEYKLSKAKSAGTVPKDVFPKLLRKLMRELPNQQANLVSGFEKCGIHPLSADPILKRLPNRNGTVTGDGDNSVSDAFTAQLQQLRNGDNNKQTRQRRKKVNVVPGRSIASEDCGGEEVTNRKQRKSVAETAESAGTSSQDTPGDEDSSAAQESEGSIELDDSEDEWTPSASRTTSTPAGPSRRRNLFDDFN